MTRSFFKTLVYLHLGLIPAALVGGYGELAGYLPSLPEQLQRFEDQRYEEFELWAQSYSWLIGSLGLALIATWVATVYMLLKFKKLGRTISVGFYVVFLITEGFFGPSVMTGLSTQSMLANWGVWSVLVFGMCYSDLKDEFT
jgi:hypothetical protein